MSATLSAACLNLIALGFIGIILSFLIQDPKKSKVALILSAIIIGLGVIQWVMPKISEIHTNRRMSELRIQQQKEIELLKERFKNQALQSAPPNITSANKK